MDDRSWTAPGEGWPTGSLELGRHEGPSERAMRRLLRLYPPRKAARMIRRRWHQRAPDLSHATDAAALLAMLSRVR